MAIGTPKTYDNNKKETNVTTHSYSNFSNPMGIDPTKISIDYWGGLCKIIISPKASKQQSTDFTSYDHENAGSIHLNHTKAKLFADIIRQYVEDPKTFPNNAGVDGKNSFICLSKNIPGAKGPCIVLTVFSPTGTSDATFVYEIKTGFHYSVKDFVSIGDEIEKEYDNVIELITLADILYDFYRNHNGAAAHFVAEYGKYDMSRIQSKLNSIAEKMGISYENKKSSNNSSGSAFSNKPGKVYTMESLDNDED